MYQKSEDKDSNTAGTAGAHVEALKEFNFIRFCFVFWPYTYTNSGFWF